MVASGGIIFHEDADKFCLHRISVIPCRFQNDNWRTVLAPAISPRTSEAVNVHNPAIPLCHDRQPSLEISSKKLVFLRGMWF
jgi:hypothetical protein